jgi:hypothetical protein
MTLSSYSYKKDLHFVVVIGDLKGDSKEIVLEILNTITQKSKNIKNISDLNIFGNLLKKKIYYRQSKFLIMKAIYKIMISRH